MSDGNNVSGGGILSDTAVPGVADNLEPDNVGAVSSGFSENFGLSVQKFISLGAVASTTKEV